MQKTYFKEEQYFTQAWLWAVLILSVAAMIVPMMIGLYTQLVLGKPWGNQPVGDVALMWIAALELAFAIGLFLLFAKMRLITTVSESGLQYRFPPLILKEKEIKKESIRTFEIRQYKPVKEYGGWGIRFGSGKTGKAYNVKGNIGMQLELNDGRKILFGTQRADVFQRAMEKMMKQSI
jgi:hypothetical protein